MHGMPVINHVEQLCDTYITTKQRRRPFPRQAMYHAHEQLELVLSDLCGPVTPVTPGGRRYFLLLVDDAFLFTWAVLLLSKGAAMGAIKQVQAAAEESGPKLRVLRTDNGGKFTIAEFAANYADEGIQRHFSAPLLATAERHCRVPESGRGHHGPVDAKAERDAGLVTREGGDDGSSTAQSLIDQKLARQDPLRGLERAHADGRALSGT